MAKTPPKQPTTPAGPRPAPNNIDLVTQQYNDIDTWIQVLEEIKKRYQATMTLDPTESPDGDDGRKPKLIIRSSAGLASVAKKGANDHKVQFEGDLYPIGGAADGSYSNTCDLGDADVEKFGGTGKPIPETEVHPSEGTWSFGDGDDEIHATGFSQVSIEPLRRGGFQMWYMETAPIDNESSGRYRGATGRVVSLGWAQLQVAPPPDGSTFHFKMIHVFSLLPRRAL